MIIQYKVKGTGSETTPFTVDLPQWKYIKVITKNKVWEIEVPDNYGKASKIYNKMIHQQYIFTKKQLDKIPQSKKARLKKFSTVDFEKEQTNR